MSVQLVDRMFKFQPQLSLDLQWCIKFRMGQANRTGNQQEASVAKPLSEKPVVSSIAMTSVADDRIGHVTEVPTDLMTPAGLGRYVD